MTTDSKWRRVWRWIEQRCDTETPPPSLSPSSQKREYYQGQIRRLNMPPSCEELALIPKVQKMFEGREAIYVEKGMLKVRVLNVRHKPGSRKIYFEVEEVRTPGLGVGLFKDAGKQPGEKLIHWNSFVFFHNISTGGWDSESLAQYSTTFYFNPQIIETIVKLAAGLPENMDSHEAYNNLGETLWNLPLDIDLKNGGCIFPIDAELEKLKLRAFPNIVAG